MSLAKQYELFFYDAETETVIPKKEFTGDSGLEDIREDFQSLQTMCDNVRKGLFARHKKLEESDNFLLGLILAQQEEIDKLRTLLIKVHK